MLSKIKNFLKRNIILVKVYEAIFTPIHWMKYRISKFQLPSMEKTHFSYGNLNKDKKFFIIKYDRQECGIISMVYHVLPKIDWAVKKKYIPIVDCRANYLRLLQDAVNAGKENAWDYYFEQPVEQYTLDEVYQSKHVIYERKIPWSRYRFCGYSMFPMEKKDYDYWSELIYKYIRPSRILCEKMGNENKQFTSLGNCMGVFIRAGYQWGGLTKHLNFCNHPKVGDSDTCINEIRKHLEMWGYDFFFLVCDDREYSERIAEVFEKKCIRMNRPLQHYFHDGVPVEDENVDVEYKDYSIQKRNEDYITECFLLAQCDSLFSWIGSGAQFSYLLNKKKYKFLEVHDEGRWAEEDFQ